MNLNLKSLKNVDTRLNTNHLCSLVEQFTVEYRISMYNIMLTHNTGNLICILQIYFVVCGDAFCLDGGGHTFVQYSHIQYDRSGRASAARTPEDQWEIRSQDLRHLQKHKSNDVGQVHYIYSNMHMPFIQGWNIFYFMNLSLILVNIYYKYWRSIYAFVYTCMYRNVLYRHVLKLSLPSWYMYLPNWQFLLVTRTCQLTIEKHRPFVYSAHNISNICYT